ncbi:hypothetical protein D081_1919 [Anaerovibrio sp. JC8]|uniref:Nif11 family protein n=1 Tax=Anaerovibrio sp. JC8 TaxID=1240085 RepID=UPI000A0B941E|nr:Nif11 family protein [Anaerovibrio sp. JC8]ORT99367.1 hypothetical protein D081_1919 [Anaerovibrio sp. JC8]
MSTENVKAFFNKALENEELAIKLKEADNIYCEKHPMPPESATEIDRKDYDDKYFAEVLQPLAEAENLPFTLEEYHLLGQTLTDDELDKVAGGWSVGGFIKGIGLTIFKPIAIPVKVISAATEVGEMVKKGCNSAQIAYFVYKNVMPLGDDLAKATVDVAVGMLRKAGRHEQAESLLRDFKKLSYRS